MCHVTCVTCHMSPVTCNLSPVTCHMLKKKPSLPFYIKKLPFLSLNKIAYLVTLVGGGTQVLKVSSTKLVQCSPHWLDQAADLSCYLVVLILLSPYFEDVPGEYLEPNP